ncbi:MAG: hypothetical protein PHP39_04575 [Oscillospiraceae bacterium]|nr:hypothetical protein [Oscillospiraceae bacterium]
MKNGKFFTVGMAALSGATILLFAAACSDRQSGIDYAASENWAYAELEQDDKEADVFFVCPKV